MIVGTADRYPWSPVPVVWDADGISINDSNEIVIYAISFMTGRRQAVVLALTFVE